MYVYPIVWKTQQICYFVIYDTQCAYIIEMQEDTSDGEPQIAWKSSWIFSCVKSNWESNHAYQVILVRKLSTLTLHSVFKQKEKKE